MERRIFLVAFNALPRHAVSKVVLGRWRLERTRLRIRKHHEQSCAERVQWGRWYHYGTHNVNEPSTRHNTPLCSTVLGSHSCPASTPFKHSHTPFPSFNRSEQRSFHTSFSSSASSSSLAWANAESPATITSTTTPTRTRRDNTKKQSSQTEYQAQDKQHSASPSHPSSSSSSSSWFSSDAFADTWILENSPTYPFSSPSSSLKKQRENGNIPYCCAEAPEGALRRNDRFDWRLRAPSQLKKPLRQFPKRTKPSTIYSTSDMTENGEYRKSIETYEQHFLPLIAAEQAEDNQSFQARLSRWPLDKLKEEGYCLTGLGAYWLQEDDFGRLVAAFQHGPGVDLPSHRFEKGIQVFMSRRDPVEETPMSGTVISDYKDDRTKILVAFPTEAEALAVGQWRLDVARSDIVYKRMNEAIGNLAYGPREVEEDEERKYEPGFDDVDKLLYKQIESLWQRDKHGANTLIESQTQTWLVGTELRDVLLKGFGWKGNEHEDHGVDGLTSGYRSQRYQDPEDTSCPGHEGLDRYLPTQSEAGGAAEAELKDKDKEKQPPLLKFEGAFKDDMRIQSWARRYSMDNPVVIEGDPDVSNLNDSQRRAVAMMIGQRASLIQGPPGTGKTKTIIETAKLLKLHFQVPHPLLVSTFTNAAVDNLVEGLAKAGLKPLRVSMTGNVRDNLAKWTVDPKMEKHELKPEIDKCLKAYGKSKGDIEDLKDEIKEDKKKLKEMPHGERADALRSIIKAKKDLLEWKEKRVKRPLYRLWRIKQQMLKEILHDADVICTTCITSANAALKVVDFPVVFLDEASMSMEPASLIPLMKGSRHVALIGDHKQLPPVVKTEEAKSQGLGISLFERMKREGAVPSIMLDTQYRMHPGISRYPSSEFYGNALRDGTVDSNGDVIVGFKPPVSRFLRLKDELGSLTKRQGKLVGTGLSRSTSVSNLDSETEVDVSVTAATTEQGYACGGKSKTNKVPPSSLPIVFVDHHGPESKKGRSRENILEVNIVISVVEDLLLHNPDLRGQDIGIISPYVSQTARLTRRLDSPELQERFRQVLGDHRAMQIPKIEIKTVDGFEGREKQVIIFSTVRNNMAGAIGFLDDKRRLNVGLTRAKRAMIIVGSIYTLKGGREDKKQADEVLERENGRVPKNEQEPEQDDDGSMGASELGAQSYDLGGHMLTSENTTTATESFNSTNPTVWHNYAQYLWDNGLVVKLEGRTLDDAIHGNWDAAKRGRVAGSIRMVEH